MRTKSYSYGKTNYDNVLTYAEAERRLATTAPLRGVTKDFIPLSFRRSSSNYMELWRGEGGVVHAGRRMREDVPYKDKYGCERVHYNAGKLTGAERVYISWLPDGEIHIHHYRWNETVWCGWGNNYYRRELEQILGLSTDVCQGMLWLRASRPDSEVRTPSDYYLPMKCLGTGHKVTRLRITPEGAARCGKWEKLNANEVISEDISYPVLGVPNRQWRSVKREHEMALGTIEAMAATVEGTYLEFDEVKDFFGAKKVNDNYTRIDMPCGAGGWGKPAPHNTAQAARLRDALESGNYMFWLYTVQTAGQYCYNVDLGRIHHPPRAQMWFDRRVIRERSEALLRYVYADRWLEPVEMRDGQVRFDRYHRYEMFNQGEVT